MAETLRNLYRSRSLIWTLSKRELKARYRGSLLGFLWSVLNPLLLLAVYSLVFTAVFSPRADVHPYALFLFGGILVWNFLSSSLLDSAETFRINGPLLRKVIVQPEIFPCVSVVAQAIHLCLALPVLAAATAVWAILFSGAVGWAALQFAPILGILFLAVLGASLCVSAVSVRFRDLRNLLQSLLTLWFFATPVIYPAAALPGRLRRWMLFNPATPFLEGVHDSVFFNRAVPVSGWISMFVVSCLALLIGALVFSRLRDSLAEEA
jgi:ABC-type polysaccharide/polyol phosphate export permease